MHHFLSYSAKDGREFAKKICEELDSVPPGCRIWMAESEVKGGQIWSHKVQEAIQECQKFLFIITKASLQSRVCLNELQEALNAGKTVIPLKLHDNITLPFQINTEHYIDFSQSENIHIAIASLRDTLDSEVEKPYPPPSTVGRIRKAYLTLPIVINIPPLEVSNRLIGREEELKSMREFLVDDSHCLLTVYGRRGCGKTATVCHLLRTSSESCHFNDNNGPAVDAIVYINICGSRSISWKTIFSEILKIFSGQERACIDIIFQTPEIPLPKKIQKFLETLSQRRIVVLLDHFDQMADQNSDTIPDADLNLAFQTLLETLGHKMKFILTMESPLKALLRFQPARQVSVDLRDGLTFSSAEQMLRELDHDGSIGIQNENPKILEEVFSRTRGNPRALEILVAVLKGDRNLGLYEVLHDTQNLLPQEVQEVLVGQAFRELDYASQTIIQAIAMYPHPVPRDAIEFMVFPFLEHQKSPAILSSLVNHRLVQKTRDLYSLDQIERRYILSTIPNENSQSHDSVDGQPINRMCLLQRGIDFYRRRQLSSHHWSSIENFAPYFAEFDLWIYGGCFQDAAKVLRHIDDRLLALGHNEKAVELYHQLDDQFIQEDTKRRKVDTLGRIYHRLGKLDEAIVYYQKGLDYVQQLEDRKAESGYLSNLAICFQESGDLDLAITYCHKSLLLAKDTQDCSRQAHVLNTLSDCWGHLGYTRRAIDVCRQTLDLARECKGTWQEALALANIGYCYGELGEFSEAKKWSQQALSLSRLIEYQLGQAAALTNLSFIDLDQNQLESATKLFKQAKQLADESNRAQIQQKARVGLALSHLFRGNLDLAAQVACEATMYELREFDFFALSVQGIIAYLQGDLSLCKDVFHMGLSKADAMLNRTPRFYLALYAKALAYTGLSMFDGVSIHREAAMEEFRRARAVNTDHGITSRTRMILSQLGKTDFF